MTETRAGVVLAAVALAIAAVASAGVAHADPTPAPGPGYQIPTQGGGSELPGAQTFPPRCLAAMLACGFRYDPGTGTWRPVADQ
jgi:hypothetical protein